MSNQFLQTTMSDIEDISKFLSGTYVSNFRIGVTKLNNRIMPLQVRLTELRVNESIVKGRILNNLFVSDLEANKAGVGTQVNPQQVLDSQRVDVSPNQAVGSTIYKAMVEQYGVRELRAELHKIDSDIQNVSTTLKLYMDKLKEFEAKIEEYESRKNTQQLLLEKATGRVVHPSTTDMEVDKIQKSVSANVSLLYHICKTYQNYTKKITTTTEGVRGYPDEKLLPQNLMILRQVFYAHVQQFPKYVEGFVNDKGESLPPLDTQDPGSDQNLRILEADLKNLRVVGKSDKTDERVAGYVRDLTSIGNDPTVSEGINKSSRPVLPEENSFNAQTEIYSQTALKMGKAYTGNWESDSLFKVIRKQQKKKAANLFKGLPLCKEQTLEGATATEEKEAEENVIMKYKQSDGAIAFKEAMAKARKLELPSPTLPKDAPDWVILYNSTFKERSNGELRISNDPIMGTPMVSPVLYSIIRTYGNSIQSASKAAMEIASKKLDISSFDRTEQGPTQFYYYDEGGKVIYFGMWDMEIYSPL